MAALIVEISTRGRGQPQYRRIRQFPYRIGRGYNNDLILPDDTVSASHLQIERGDDGVIRVRNLSFENGTLLDGRKLGYVPIDVVNDMSLQMGHTIIRLIDPVMDVKPARLSHHYPGPMQLASKLPFALFMLVLLWILEAWQFIDSATSKHGEKEMWLVQLPQLIFPLFLATVTGFISRLLLHRWQYALQLSIACIALLMLTATQEIQLWLSYYYSNHDTGTVFFLFTVASVFTALFAWQLRAFSNLSRERAAFTSIAIVWPLIIVLSLPSWLREPDFRSQPAMHILLRASDDRQLNTIDINRFIEQLDHDLQTEH